MPTHSAQTVPEPKTMPPNLPKHELSLFLSRELFDFALDEIGINFGEFGEELRSGPVVTFKTRRRR